LSINKDFNEKPPNTLTEILKKVEKNKKIKKIRVIEEIEENRLQN